MNAPNLLTVSRVALIPVFMYLLLIDIPYNNFWAAALFSLAAITDYLDGYLARQNNMVTKLGTILDPLADKLMITAALVILVQLGAVPGWVVVIILGREFAVMGLRIVISEKGVIMPASIWGKVKTHAQIYAIILVILNNEVLQYIGYSLGYWAMLIAMVITILSGIEYLVQAVNSE